MKHLRILLALIISVSMVLYCGTIGFAMEEVQPEEIQTDDLNSSASLNHEGEIDEAVPADWDIHDAQDFQSMLTYLSRGERPCVANLLADINYPYPVQATGNDLTILGHGHTLSGVPHYVALDGRTITFGNANGDKLTLIGNDRRSIDNDNYGLLVTEKSGQLNMYSGVTLKDNYTVKGMGGAVTLRDGGTFHMYGGTIQNCGVEALNYAGSNTSYGGAVAVLDNSTFIMDGGIIENCYSESKGQMGGGGAVMVGNATFIMNGGTIRGCNANRTGGAILVQGASDEYGTQSTINSHIEINGGTISGNTARAGAGICVKSYNYDSGEESQGRTPKDSAVSSRSLLDIKNCTITGNKATGIGGAVLLQDIRVGQGKEVEISACTITNNTAADGGGIAVCGSYTEVAAENCTISGNDGGVYVTDNKLPDAMQGYVSIEACSITNNNGYGVKFDDVSRVCLEGVSTIIDNKADGSQANVVGATTANPLVINSDISGSKIGITDSKIAAGGTTPETRLTSGYGMNNTTDPWKVFVSDQESWIPVYAEGNYKEEVKLYKSTELTYTLHFNNGEEDQTKNYDVSEPAALPTLTSDDPDRTFDGWYDNKECSGTAVTATPDKPVGHVDYYAKWNVHTHSNLSECTGHPATCTEAGQITYYECSCGKWFEDSAATKLIENHDAVIIPAKGHTEVTDEEVKPSCTESGLTEGKHCSVCDTVIVAQEEIQALGHIDEDEDQYCDRCGIYLGTDPEPEPDPTPGPTPDPTPAPTPDTGDANGLLLWITLGFTSLLLLFGAFKLNLARRK